LVRARGGGEIGSRPRSRKGWVGNG
jgi:hypothetical protein